MKEKAAGENWDYHVSLVVQYAVKLAELLDADREITELGALLHDIAWVTNIKYDHDHHISGQPMAQELMRSLGYPQKKIDKVKHIIASHRGSLSGDKPETLEALIVANADAMAHFDVVPWLLMISYNNHDKDVKKAVRWVSHKLERDWNKKITLPEAKSIIEEKYKAAMLLLKEMAD